MRKFRYMLRDEEVLVEYDPDAEELVWLLDKYPAAVLTHQEEISVSWAVYEDYEALTKV